MSRSVSVSPSRTSPAKRGRPRRDDDLVTPVRAIDRALTVLEAVAESPSGTSVHALAQSTGLPLSTVYRLVETLRHRGYLSEDDAKGCYVVGFRAFQVGAVYSAASRLSAAARPIMQQLVDELGETVNLGVIEGGRAIYLDQVSASRMMRTFVQTGAEAPLHCSGVGKVLLAYNDSPEALPLSGLDLTRYTERTLVDPEDLTKELERVRKLGYAVDDQEREAGVRCVAVPIFDAVGGVVAALSISGPAGRMDGEQLASLGLRLGRAAEVVTARLN